MKRSLKKLVLCAMLLSVTLLCVSCISEDYQPDSPTIIYVHGFQSKEQDTSQIIRILEEAYPQATEIKPWKWEAPELSSNWQTGPAWGSALMNTRDASEQLYRYIQGLTKRQQKSLVLVGHSLGGRVVIEALDKCNDSNIIINHFVLAGAAIHNNSPAIKHAIDATIYQSFNLVNMRDYALGAYCLLERNSALGTGYALADDTTKLKEIAFKMEHEHDVHIYLQKYMNCVKQNDYSSEEILVVQDYLNWRNDVIDLGVFRDCLDNKGGWEIQKHHITGHCRIISPTKERMAWGREPEMTFSFAKVKNQLPENAIIKKGHQDVVVIQDKPNANMPTGGGDIWWNNLNDYQGWKLQQNKVTRHCRILDPKNIRRAWGTKDSMTNSFNDVVRQLKEFGY